MGDTAKFPWLEDPRPTAELLALAHREWMEDDDELGEEELPLPWDTMSILRWRASPEVFQTAQHWCQSGDPMERRLGIIILRSIGRETGAFHAEAVALLLQLLSDADPSVIAEAAYALGERSDPVAIPYLLPLRGHSDPEVRSGVVSGLSCDDCHDDLRAIAALIELSRDAVAQVRDWATFGLGDLTEIDTPELRAALVARLTDPHPNTRGEALVGLAKRRDERAIEPILRELAGEFHGAWAVEAAGIFGLPIFYKSLLPQRAEIEKHLPWSLNDYDEALVACRPHEDTPNRADEA